MCYMYYSVETSSASILFTIPMGEALKKKKGKKYFKEENAKDQKLVLLIIPGIIHILIFYTLLCAVINNDIPRPTHMTLFCREF